MFSVQILLSRRAACLTFGAHLVFLHISEGKEHDVESNVISILHIIIGAAWTVTQF